MIKACGLTKNYGNFSALKGVDIEIEKGKIIGLLGANGSGKTTFIKLVAGLLSPTGGSIEIDGSAPGVESKKRISYLSESNALDLGMKVETAINYYADFFDDFNKERAVNLLKGFEIDLKKKIKNLSKGMKEKVQLVLCISRNADYYLLDEPIGGVDPAARDNILDTILSNFNEKATVIISTHLISDIERVLDEIIFINKGEVVLHKGADELRGEREKSIDAIFREDFRC